MPNACVLLKSLLKFEDERGTNVPLYFHPPITTSNSKKIITPTIDPTDILFIKPFYLDCFTVCSATFNIITTKRKRTATAPT